MSHPPSHGEHPPGDDVDLSRLPPPDFSQSPPPDPSRLPPPDPSRLPPPDPAQRRPDADLTPATAARELAPPPPAQALPGAGTDEHGKVFERPHPLTPLIRGWVVLVALLFVFGRQLLPDSEGQDLTQRMVGSIGWVLLVVAAVVVLAAVAGLLSWWFTKFVVDTEELRIETGWLFRQSKRIPFQRLQSIDVEQPLAARLFGLAELRLEAGGGDSGARLRYLGRAKASRLRDYLLTRAAGEQGQRDEEAEPASAWTDIGRSDDVLVRLTPRQLVLGFLLSPDLIIPLLLVAVGLVVTAATGVVVFALPVLIPLLIGLATALSRNVIGQFNYTLSRSGASLRVSRGLTSLTSQSAPIDRIQGIRISQPVTWRRLDLWQVKIDVLGATASATAEDSGNRQGLSLLFPVASRAQVDTAMGLILPGVDLTAVPLHRSPRSAGWLRWFEAPTLRHGADDQVVMTRRGVLFSITDIVPHAKTQSVRTSQGPWQRRLGLASVNIDTTPGPVVLTVLHVSPEVARRFATEQLERMRRSRAQAPAAAETPSAATPAEQLPPADPGPDQARPDAPAPDPTSPGPSEPDQASPDTSAPAPPERPVAGDPAPPRPPVA